MMPSDTPSYSTEAIPVHQRPRALPGHCARSVTRQSSGTLCVIVTQNVAKSVILRTCALMEGSDYKVSRVNVVL